MALISKEGLESIAQRLVRVRHFLTLIGIVAPIVYLSIVSTPDFIESTVISDKALLPGLVDETWNNHGDLNAYLKTLNEFRSEK